MNFVLIYKYLAKWSFSQWSDRLLYFESKDKSCEDNEWRQLNTLFFMNDSVGEWLILTVTAKTLNKIIYVTPKN